MKLIIFLVVLASVNCAKLDRTYLPPHAQTSGGTGNILETPNFEPSPFQADGNNAQRNFNQGNFAQGNLPQGNLPQRVNSFVQQNEVNNIAFAPNNAFAQNSEGSGFAPNNFSPSANSANEDSVVVDSFDATNPGSNFQTASNIEFERPERPRAALDRNAAILRMDSTNDGETYAYAYETDNGISADENGVATNGVEAQGGFSYTGDDGKVYSIRYTADQNGFVPQGDHLPTPPPIPEEILKALEQNAADEAAGIFDDGSYNAEKYGDANELNNKPEYGNNNVNYPNNNNVNFPNNNNNYAQNSNFAPTNRLEQNPGNFAQENSFGQNAAAFAFNNLTPNGETNFVGDDEDTVVTNSADDFPSFANQRTPSFRGSAETLKSQGPAYLPPVRR